MAVHMQGQELHTAGRDVSTLTQDEVLTYETIIAALAAQDYCISDAFFSQP